MKKLVRGARSDDADVHEVIDIGAWGHVLLSPFSSFSSIIA